VIANLQRKICKFAICLWAAALCGAWTIRIEQETNVVWVSVSEPNTNVWRIEYSWAVNWDTNGNGDWQNWYWSYGPGCITTGQAPVGFFTSGMPFDVPFQLYRARLIQ
jgi:hypothetical protein